MHVGDHVKGTATEGFRHNIVAQLKHGRVFGSCTADRTWPARMMRAGLIRLAVEGVKAAPIKHGFLTGKGWTYDDMAEATGGESVCGMCRHEAQTYGFPEPSGKFMPRLALRSA